MSDEWRVLIAETLTGNIVADVAPSAAPGFSRVLNGPGSLSVAARVDAKENASIDFHSYISPRYSWVVAFGNYIAQAGPTWTASFDDASKVLTVSGAGIGSIFNRRVTRNASGTIAIVDTSQDLTYTSLSSRAVIGKLISDNMAQSYASLPITLSNLTETGTNTVTYFGYDLKDVMSNISDLAKIDPGVEWDFAPQFVSANQAQIQWVLNAASPNLGDQSSNGVWDYGGSLTTIDVDINASVSPVSRVWVKGSGSDRGLQTGFYQDLTQAAAGYPLLDFVDSNHTSATTQAQLDGWAQADQKAYNAAFETWKCGVRIDGTLSNNYGTGAKVAPGLGDFALGDAPTFYVDRHPWITAGAYRRRIMGFQSSSPWTVDLTLYQTLSFS